MDRNQLIQRLMATFLEELGEHVRALNSDLLALEKETGAPERTERLTTLFRTAHSLKGAARSVNVTPIETACHQLEEILAGARDGVVPLTPDLFAVLFATADAFDEEGRHLREGRDLREAPLGALVARLAATADMSRGQLPAPIPRARTPAQGPPVESPRTLSNDKLRKVEAVEPAAVPTPERVPPLVPIATPAAPEPATSGGHVRVLAEKLDALLGQSGELLVARRRVQSRADDLLTVRESVGRWKGDWRAVEKALGKHLLQDRVKNENEDEPDTASLARLLPRRAVLALRRNGDRLRQLEKDLERLSTAMAADGRALDQAAGSLDDEVRRVRMFPFFEACEGLDRMVRDLAQASGKEVDVVIEGGTVALDRSVLDGLKDPLRHLVRNAIDHGAEGPEERRAAGKPPQARVTVAAALRGAQVEVVVFDDGRGLNLEAIRQQVRKRKLAEPADERELVRSIFLSGFSTSAIITDVSGRGVGLDVVRSRTEALHGTVDVSFTPGRGTRFILAVPLTLTTLRAVLISAAGQTFALVGTHVEKLVRVAPENLRSVEGREMLALGGSPLPVASVAETLGFPARKLASNNSARGLIVAAGGKRVVFVVDEFLQEQEIVVKGLGARIRSLRHISGATILPSGQIALVLNAANLIASALARTPARALAAGSEETAQQNKKRILLAEDSVTTRALEKSILETAGYEVLSAADGEAAWELLQEKGADLVVSDVEMPRMDGFGLTERVRGSKRFADLPVILVTARETELDKARGIAVGANAYLGKSAFDQKSLLQTIDQLL